MSRKEDRYETLRLSIIDRDDGKCQGCGGSSPPLVVHHRLSREARPDLIEEPANLITLCRSCHMLLEAGYRRAAHFQRAEKLSRYGIVGRHWRRLLQLWPTELKGVEIALEALGRLGLPPD
jgi:5-methylcytosine-specific restriction endonuclease McrA